MAMCQDWTCEECAEGGAALGEVLSTPNSLSYQIIILLGICPQHPDPEYCIQNIGDFWAVLGPIVWTEHYSHICDDLECPSFEKQIKVLSV